MTCTLVWFRRDLRISDHAPLERAARRGEVIPVFIWDAALLKHPETGSARVAFLLDCLRELDQELRQRQGRLILRTGNPVLLLPQLLRETGAEGIYAHTDCERIYGRVRDARLNQALEREGMRIRWFEPTASISDLIPYPEYRQLWFEQMREPMIPTPSWVRVPEAVKSESFPTLQELGHQPDGKVIPQGGTTAARNLLIEFLREKTHHYYWQLSYPSAEVTSGLSPYLKFGVISLRECFQRVVLLQMDPDRRIQMSGKQIVSRLRWGSGFTQRFRYLPQLELQSLYPVFDQEDGEFEEEFYERWQQGETGFPIVDAAARCLAATGGWKAMNFRSRSIYASFLSNLLGIDWRYGALHFMRHLIDGDCPIDHYQWAMQAGVTQWGDQKWTRIYNPEQVAVNRCDPEGSFIKQWIPELSQVPPEQLGSPLSTPHYPPPMLNYKQARSRRVEFLTRKRKTLGYQPSILPHLARMPTDVTPFGSERFQAEVAWAGDPAPNLFPTALNLNELDEQQSLAIKTWFVAQEMGKPPRIRERRSRIADDFVTQLTLFNPK